MSANRAAADYLASLHRTRLVEPSPSYGMAKVVCSCGAQSGWMPTAEAEMTANQHEDDHREERAR